MKLKETELRPQSPSTLKPRNLYLDSLRGLAVYLVILGHAMSNFTMSYYQGGFFWLDPWHIAIYSFHMPLFALISGYLFVKALDERNPWSFASRKLPNLLVPWIIWGGITWCVKAIQADTGLFELKLALKHIIGYYWFITTISIVMLLVWAVYRYLRYPWVVFLALLLALQLLPASKIPMYDFLRIKETAFLLPFFVFGLECNKHQEKCLFYLSVIVMCFYLDLYLLLLFCSQSMIRILTSILLGSLCLIVLWVCWGRSLLTSLAGLLAHWALFSWLIWSIYSEALL